MAAAFRPRGIFWVPGPWLRTSAQDTRATRRLREARLTLTSYLVGARYKLPQPWLDGEHKPQPFAQVLVGAAHAGGGVAGAGDGSYEFAARMGGGIDVPVSSRFAVRVIQVDYYLTNFANATNAHQNNLLVGAGIVFHWSQ